MIRKIILLFLMVPLLSFQGLHKFYVSVTEIEYNQENRSLQIISRVFIDDMENLLKTRYDDNLYLTRRKEHPSADEFLERYISQKMTVTVNGEKHSLNYLGKEYENDILVLYIEILDVAPIEDIAVKNEVLTDLFPEQKNVVHVEYKGKTKSLLLSRQEERGLLNFK